MNNIHLEPLGGGLEIYVSESYRFSTDTILLANFSQPKGRKKCVDLGTGCGTIPLIWLTYLAERKQTTRDRGGGHSGKRLQARAGQRKP